MYEFVISDFDGTVAQLVVDWAALRSDLGVRSIRDLWSDRQAPWHVIARAEIVAAKSAKPITVGHTFLEEAQSIAIVTNNDAEAVRAFLRRFPALENRVQLIIGRTELNGPKEDFAIFSKAIEHTRNLWTSTTPPRYLGDQTYELSYAADLGLQSVDICSLRADEIPTN